MGYCNNIYDMGQTESIIILMEPLDPLLPKLFAPKDIVEELEMTPQHISRLCRSGEITAQKIGQTWIITPLAVALYKKKPKNGRGNPDFGKRWKGRGKDYGSNESAENTHD